MVVFNCGKTIGNYWGQGVGEGTAQVGITQFAGCGASILRGWPAGMIWTTMFTAHVVPSLRIRCTSPQPTSVKLSPAW
jgi:hypothetical protein